MKLALISQPFDVIVPPSMNSIGIWVYEVSRRLAKEHQVIVYGRRGALKARKGIGQQVKTHYVFSFSNSWLSNLSSRTSRYFPAKKPLFSSPAFYLEYILPIALHLKKEKVDLVHLQNFSQFVPVIRAFNPNIKIVLHMRCEWLALLDYEMINRRLAKTDLILGVSNEITGEIRERFPHYAHKCDTAYTGVDTERFKPAPPTGEIREKGRSILFVGRVTPEKGIHVLLEAFKQIASRFPDVHVNIVGSKSTLPKDRLVGLSEEKKITDLQPFYERDYRDILSDMLPAELKERVHFTGHVRYDQILEYYQNTDVLVNAALTEPFGRSLIEANACGVPIIASRAGGMTELINHGQNGLLVQPGDADDLARAIAALLENESLRQKMGEAGRQFILDHFTWDQIASRLLVLYNRVLFSDPMEGKNLTEQHAVRG